MLREKIADAGIGSYVRIVGAQPRRAISDKNRRKGLQLLQKEADRLLCHLRILSMFMRIVPIGKYRHLDYC